MHFQSCPSIIYDIIMCITIHLFQCQESFLSPEMLEQIIVRNLAYVFLIIIISLFSVRHGPWRSIIQWQATHISYHSNVSILYFEFLKLVANTQSYRYTSHIRVFNAVSYWNFNVTHSYHIFSNVAIANQRPFLVY